MVVEKFAIMLNRQSMISSLILLLIAILIIALDQWTKAVASSELVYAQPIEVLPFLNWTLLHNYGAAFSFLSDQGGWQRWLLTGISFFASIAFIVWLLKTAINERLLRVSLMLVIAGAIGNLIDRAFVGYVVDFISVHWQSRYFYPAFNIADMAISIGAALMVLDMFLSSKKEVEE